MPVILQNRLPIAAWLEERTRRLPGTQPVAPGDWLRVDEAYAGQMAERDRLLATTRETVLALHDGARVAAEELLEHILQEIAKRPDYEITGDSVLRPDGVRVPIDRADPLLTAGRLVQEDLCILEKPEGAEEHILTGAVLCFPASWTLREKFMRSLTSIHVPVPRYDADVAKRVQRLFDAVRPEQPIWRANALLYASAELHHPRPENAPRKEPLSSEAFVRAERQCLLRLPVSRAVIFSIHTYVVRRDALDEAQEAGLKEHPFHRFSA